MSRTITVVTPENIQVTYQLGGFASRFMAVVVDLLLQILLILLVGVVFGLASGGPIVLASFVTAVGIVVAWVVLVAYPIFFEMLWAGQTPGKRLFGLRVVRDGGHGPNLVASVLRNLGRIADYGIVPLSVPLVLLGLPGLVSVFLSPTYKRIGDYLAGTLVIVEASSSPFGTGRKPIGLPAGANIFYPSIKNPDRVTIDEYRMIRRFVERRGEFDIPVQAAIGERIARPILERLEIDVPIAYQIQYADFLAALERRYAEDFGLL